MTYENLKLEVAAGLATLTIDRPKALNALNTATLRELEAALPGPRRRTPACAR